MPYGSYIGATTESGREIRMRSSPWKLKGIQWKLKLPESSLIKSNATALRAPDSNPRRHCRYDCQLDTVNLTPLIWKDRRQSPKRNNSKLFETLRTRLKNRNLEVIFEQFRELKLFF